MAVFIVLWPSLLTTKLKSVIRHNLGHSNYSVTKSNQIIVKFMNFKTKNKIIQCLDCEENLHADRRLARSWSPGHSMLKNKITEIISQNDKRKIFIFRFFYRFVKRFLLFCFSAYCDMIIFRF